MCRSRITGLFGLVTVSLALMTPSSAFAANPAKLSINCTPKGSHPGLRPRAW